MNFITLGTFDGVHLGHRRLLGELACMARISAMKSLVLYFTEPPRAVLSGCKTASLLTLPHEREKLILSCGPDAAAPLKCDRRFLAQSPETFFKRQLLGRYKAGALLVGRDFAFGKNRAGHLDFLRRACLKERIPLFVHPFICSQGRKISSSGLRLLVKEGKLDEAASQLGRYYSAGGKIVHGQGLGRKLGFPTANLDVDPRKLLPSGVFAAHARLGDSVFAAVVNVGQRPTLDKPGPLLLEAHLLDFSRNIYGRVLEVEFVSRLRHEMKFGDLAALCRQLRKDAAHARKILKLAL